MSYDDRQEALRAEAMRTVPGVMAAKHREDVTGAAQLIEDFRQTAVKLGITDGIAWSILFSATLHWSMEIVDALANTRGIEVEQVLQTLGAQALAWMSEERGVGGY